jgi:hypothetical protein
MVLAKGQNIFSQETIVWNSIHLPLRFSSKWQAPVDVSYRTIGVSSSAYQYTFRTGLRRFINETWSVASGVALFFTRTSFDKADHEFTREFRLWQEVAAEKKLKNKFVLQNRFRLEERFFDATGGNDSYTAIRFRYRVGIAKYLGEKLRVQLAEEYMEHLTSSRFSFQQNRIYFSWGYLLNKLTQIEAGYIWSKIPDLTRHYITLSFQRTILFHGKRNS